MKNKKVFKIEGKSIYVYDDVFNHQENIEIYALASQSPFIRTNLDNNFYNMKDLYLKWSCLLNDPNPLLFLLNKKYFENIEELKDKNVEIQRQYINFSTSETVDLMHIDSRPNAVNEYTILHYANFIWDKNWHGETVFYNSIGEEILLSTMIKPGRIVVFDSTILHSARAPSLFAEYARYTIASKITIR